jgi:Fe-Mn family superoxide dismutase
MCKKMFIIGLALGLASVSMGWAQAPTQARYKVSIDYPVKDYSHLLGMPGFSDQLLNMHFQLYQGYVKNSNLILTTLRDWALQDKAQNYEYGALKRRLGWEFDGMRLHELYFDNLGGKKESVDKGSTFYQRLLKDFGSYDHWKADFVATGLMRGIGWAILYRDPESGRLINVWINEHDLGHLAGGTPLLVMDVFEHAYMPQYGLDRAKYIDAFFDNINWALVMRRFDESSRR